jgi:hypothetical protein
VVGVGRGGERFHNRLGFGIEDVWMDASWRGGGGMSSTDAGDGDPRGAISG